MKDVFRYYFRFGRRPPQRDLQSDTEFQIEGHPLLMIWLQYIALFLGILAQPIIVQLKTNELNGINFEYISWHWAIISLILACLIFPGVYRPQNPSPHPRLVQFCILFAAGMGWQAMVNSLIPI